MEFAGCQPSRQDRKGSLQKKEKMVPACFAKNCKVPGDSKENSIGETNKVDVEEPQQLSSEANLTFEPTEVNAKMTGIAGLVHTRTGFSKQIPLISPSDRG